MPVVYQAEFHYTKEKEVFALTRTLPDGTQDTSPVNLDEIHQLEDQTRDFYWNKSQDSSRQIGKQLFTLLNGDRQTLLRALKEADDYDETLQLIVEAGGPASNLEEDTIFEVTKNLPLEIDVEDTGSLYGR